MWGKFKQLEIIPKVLVGFIAIIALPITILILSCEMFIKSIKNKKVINLILSGILVVFISSALISGFTSPDPVELSAGKEITVSKNEKKVDEKKTETSKVEKKANKEKTDDKSKNQEPKKDVERKEAETKKISAISKPVEKPVMNGINTERIGTRLESYCAYELLEEKELIEFYNEYVKNSNYNYITLNFGNENGIVFSGNMNFFMYGELDNTGSITNGLGDGEIKNNHIIYENK